MANLERLIHLIYVSTARRNLTEVDLDSILTSAVRNNTQRSLTGMLLYVNGSFMQVLEGEEQQLDEIFDRVQRDPRHHDVIVLERERILERSFASWSMGFKRIDPTKESIPEGYAPLIARGFDAKRIGAQPGVALDLLVNFGLSQR